MKVIDVRNVNHALKYGLRILADCGELEQSRNGRVLVSPDPVTTVYRYPRERVLFNELRDANPFFHYMESMWMLMGMHDVATPAQYARQMEYYTDDGETLNGAYGYRWRRYFGYDQLREIVSILDRDPSSRRCVLAMWSGARDLMDQTSKDLPCNTQIYFRVLDEKLHMMVTCRSNDIIWGAYGANVVHMSFLQEYLACWLGLGIGTYEQVSFNYHLYPDRPDVERLISRRIGEHRWITSYQTDDRYSSRAYIPAPLLFWPSIEHAAFLEACSETLLDGPSIAKSGVLAVDTVMRPLMTAHAMYKTGDLEAAHRACGDIKAEDWRTACRDWIDRRIAAKTQKEPA